MTTNFEALAKKIVQRARRRGADEAEIFIQVGRQADVRVRDGDIEDLTQATSKGAGLRVFVKKRLGFAWTSDFSDQSVDLFVDRAIALAEASAPNRQNGLPEAKGQLPIADVGSLYDAEVASLPPDWKINASIEMEKIVRSFDSRIQAIDSVGAGESVSEIYLASSTGASHAYQCTSVYLYASPVASDGTQLQTSTWYDAKRFFADLESPEQIAREAARRAVRLLGAKKVKSQRVPVIFDPSVAASFVGSIAAAANGDSVFKKASFLATRLGEKLGPASVTIVNDGTLARGLATAPFDGEGVATRRTAIVERGVLSSFLYDVFTARKARAHSTGSASRGYRSLPNIGTSNLYLEAGTHNPLDLIAEVPNGFYVTAMLGHGANMVTGEYSRGANGLWIENGELTQPVQEVTVAGNLLDMVANIAAIGNDLSFRSATASPTIRFRELTVAGE